MTLQWSASKTELLLQCARPFQEGVETPDNAEEPTRYGSAYHELMEVPSPREKDLMPVALRLEKKWDLPGAALELVPHVQASKRCLYDWLAGKNDFDLKLDIKLGLKEAAFSVNPWTKRARRISPPTVDGHIYRDVTSRDEMPMTADLMFPRLVVIDYKSGRDPLDFLSIPETHGQLLTLGLSCAWAPIKESFYPGNSKAKDARWWCPACRDGVDCVFPKPCGPFKGSIILAVLHAERGQAPIIHASLVSREELEEHAQRLQVAMHRAGDGSIRDGACCRVCPARHDCPTQVGKTVQAAAEIIEAGADILAQTQRAEIETMTVDDWARFHYFLKRFRKLAEVGDKILRREYVKAMAAEGRPGINPNGEVLVFKTKAVHRVLGMGAIREKFGKVEGEAIIEELEARGLIEETEQEELRAVDDT